MILTTPWLSIYAGTQSRPYRQDQAARPRHERESHASAGTSISPIACKRNTESESFCFQPWQSRWELLLQHSIVSEAISVL